MGTLKDDPVHMSVPPDEYIPDVELPRFSEDKGHVNNNGLLLLEFCKQTGLRIVNGRVGIDKGMGKCTFVGSRGYSVVDYVLSTQDLFKCVNQFEVHDPNVVSDHCLITFSVTFQINSAREVTENDYDQAPGKFMWNNDFKTDFLSSLKNAGTEKLNRLNASIPNCTENYEIDQCLSELTSIIKQTASPIFKKSSNKSQSMEHMFPNKNGGNPWYDERCIEKKYDFLRMLNKFRESKNDANRIGLVKARLEYKTMLRKCRYEYDREKTSRFVTARYKNARLYWNLLKESAGVRSTTVPLSTFEQYFRAVNNPADQFYIPYEDVLYFNERYKKKKT